MVIFTSKSPMSLAARWALVKPQSERLEGGLTKLPRLHGHDVRARKQANTVRPHEAIWRAQRCLHHVGDGLGNLCELGGPKHVERHAADVPNRVQGLGVVLQLGQKRGRVAAAVVLD
eukprot:4703435-Pyramimonas_sp.AAC.1